MSGLINFIKSLFSGIFGFFGGLLGQKKANQSLESAPKTNKKRNGYFLELEDSKNGDSKQAEAASSAAKALVEAPPAQQPMTVSKETLVEAAEVADAKADGKSAKTSSRKEKLAALAASDKPASVAGQEVAPAPKATSVVATPEPEAEHAFATKYLIPANNGTRRRPGANMSSFLDMARTIKAG